MLPSFKTCAGNLLKLPSLSEGDERFYVQNSNVEECNQYKDDLINLGFSLYSENFIPSADDYLDQKNVAYTLTSSERHVFLFYDVSLHTNFVVATPVGELPKKELYDDSLKFDTSITQLKLLRGGMSYAAILGDGSFLLVDGGLYYAPDENELFNFLKENTKNGEKPHIRLWLITHPHLDHVELLLSFLENHKNDVEIDAFAHQFIHCDDSVFICDIDEGLMLKSRFYEKKAASFPNAKLYFLHTGQVFYLPGAELEILSTMDNSFPSLFFSCNDISVISRLKFYGGSTVMLLADAANHNCRQLARTYGKYLKSDILQLAHHGLLGGDIELYKLIDPDICLWSVKEDVFFGTRENQKYRWCLGEGGLDFNKWIRDDSIKKRVHYHHSKTVTISTNK